jgi:hypothetical protein
MVVMHTGDDGDNDDDDGRRARKERSEGRARSDGVNGTDRRARFPERKKKKHEQRQGYDTSGSPPPLDVSFILIL